jgi:hypothetical protein
MTPLPSGNAGVHTLDDFICDAIASAPSDVSRNGPAQRGLSVELVLDRDFSSYAPEEQDSLIAAIRQLLVAKGEVRVVRRTAKRASA